MTNNLNNYFTNTKLTKIYDYLFLIVSLILVFSVSLISDNNTSVYFSNNFLILILSLIYLLSYRNLLIQVIGVNYFYFLLLIFLIPLLSWMFYLFYDIGDGSIIKFIIAGHIVYYSFFLYLCAFIVNMYKIFSYRLLFIILLFYILIPFILSGAIISINEYGEKNYIGEKLILIMPLFFYLGICSKQIIVRTLTIFLTLGLIFIFVASTIIYPQKILILCFLFQIIFLILLSKHKLIVFSLLILFIFIFFNSDSELFLKINERFSAMLRIDDEGSSSNLRFKRYIELIMQLANNYVPILLGTGLGMSSYLSSETGLSGSHSGFFGFLSSVGFMVTAIYILFIYSILKINLKQYRNFKLIKISSIILLSLLLYSLFEDRIFPVGDFKFLITNYDFILVFSILFLASKKLIYVMENKCKLK